MAYTLFPRVLNSLIELDWIRGLLCLFEKMGEKFLSLIILNKINFGLKKFSREFLMKKNFQGNFRWKKNLKGIFDEKKFQRDF